MAHWKYSVAPRYTSGSPALVTMERAERLARFERGAYLAACSGRYGPVERARALRLGLAGVVVAWTDDRRVRVVADLITGRNAALRLDGEHLDVHSALTEEESHG